MATWPRLALTLAFWLALAGSPALAQGGLRIIPVPPGVKPAWQAVPGAPKASFAPNIPTDVFRYKKTYYLYWDGMWFVSKSLEGPWELPRKVPKAVRRIPPSFFKSAGRGGPPLPGPGREPFGGGAPGGPSRGFGPTPEARPWSPPGTGLAEPIPPADVTPPGWFPSPPQGPPPGQEGPMPAPGDAPVPSSPPLPSPEGTPAPGQPVPKAM